MDLYKQRHTHKHKRGICDLQLEARDLLSVSSLYVQTYSWTYINVHTHARGAYLTCSWRHARSTV